MSGCQLAAWNVVNAQRIPSTESPADDGRSVTYRIIVEDEPRAKRRRGKRHRTDSEKRGDREVALPPWPSGYRSYATAVNADVVRPVRPYPSTWHRVDSPPDFG